MKIFLSQNVYDAALERINWVFSEFKNVVVCVSGGKDSRVIYELSLKVARERGRLPMTVMFIDQEAEWQATVDQCEDMLLQGEVNPRWYQMPIQILNATSSGGDAWLQCWDPDEEGAWMRERHPVSVKENIYGTKRFNNLFIKIADVEYPAGPMAYLAGVRTEESHVRFIGITQNEVYKGRTWGKKLNPGKGHFTFYPLYDWSYSDIWHAIISNSWSYNEIYRKLMAQGTQPRRMRISNLHHEKSVWQLFRVQEFEPATYEKLVRRLPGADMAGKFGHEQYFVHNLPFVFDSWREYRDYLTEHLTPDAHYEIYKKKWKALDREARHYRRKQDLHKKQVQSVLTNDWEFVKLQDYLTNAPYFPYRQYLQGRRAWEDIEDKDKEVIDRKAILKEREEVNAQEPS